MKKQMFMRLFLVSMLFVGLNLFVSCESESLETTEEVAEQNQDEIIKASTAKGGNLSGEVTGSSGAYVAKVNGVTKYTGGDYVAAIQAAINGLTSGRDVKE